jgi:tetratricopeptide (TPR) repeat protein
MPTSSGTGSNALRRNDRETAHAALTSLHQTHGGTDLTLATELKFAQFDLNWAAANECCRQFLERYPDGLRWRMEHLYILRQLHDEGQLRHALEGLAEQTAREAVRRAPNVPESWGFLAHFLWKRERRDEAYAEVWRTVQRYPEYDWGWSRIERWPAVLERTEEALQRTREFVGKHPQSIRPALSLLTQLDAAGLAGQAEALQAVARLLDRHPKLVQGHDWRAYLLARDHRYEEALKACAPPVFEGQVPAPLQARSAWVEWQAGRRAEAIESMLRVVKADPNNVWSFGQLTRWALAEENSAIAVDAAARWVKLQPNSADAWYNRGQALARTDQFEEAIAAYRRALQLAPADETPALTLLKLLFSLNRTSEAETFVRSLEASQSTAFVASCRCVLVARRALTLQADHATDLLRSAATLLLARHGHWQEAREELGRVSRSTG